MVDAPLTPAMGASTIEAGGTVATRPSVLQLPRGVAVARQPLELKPLVRAQAGQPLPLTFFTAFSLFHRQDRPQFSLVVLDWDPSVAALRSFAGDFPERRTAKREGAWSGKFDLLEQPLDFLGGERLVARRRQLHPDRVDQGL